MKVTGESTRKIDVVSAPGVDGGATVDKGYQPAKLTMVVRMWTDQHRLSWDALVPHLAPKPGKGKPKPLDFVHVGWNKRGVRSVLVESMSGEDIKGDEVTVTVKLIQFFKPKASGVKKQTGGKLASLSDQTSGALKPDAVPIGPQPLPSAVVSADSPTGPGARSGSF